MSADLLRRAAAKIRSSAPLIEYTTEMSDPTERIKYVQYQRTPRHRWGWRNNIRPALRTLFGRRTSVDRLLGVKWRERPFFAWHALIERHTRDVPEVALDEGNVLIFWSEVAPHIALWTPGVATDMADLFDIYADLAEREGYPAEPESPVLRLARRILGEDA